ncbi:unnamed protein product [Lymnaea stagnalis]|uniref:Uncharacterized protein n=1 Tax=Lymnaea stagnalis TaxID=6523 RepID=A0AAV2HD95_LYMST
MLRVLLYTLAATTVTVLGQHQCPVCTNELDYKSCTGVRVCDTAQELCLLRIDTALNNRVEYHCSNPTVCERYAASPCDPTHGRTCYYCCTDVDSCKGQLESMFFGILAMG